MITICLLDEVIKVQMDLLEFGKRKVTCAAFYQYMQFM